MNEQSDIVGMTAPYPAGRAPNVARRALEQTRRALPEGRELPEDEWAARHRAILLIIWAHAIGVAIFGLITRQPLPLVIGESAAIALIGALAAWTRPRRRFRGSVAALALVTSSAIIVQFSGGYIEAHFHFFVVLAVIALYQDWIPFLLAITYVAVDHGLVGTLVPSLVYNHGDAFAHPWKWALIHASLVLGESTALLMGWKVAEQARRRTALVLDSAGEGILGLDLDGRITFANPAAAAMTQLAVGDLQGRPVDAFIVASNGTAPLAESWLPDAEAFAPGTTMQVRRKDGALVPVELERTPIRNNNAVIGAVITLKDITERKKAEEALRNAVSTLTATLESTTDGILVIDHSGRIAGFNRRFVEMWGVPMTVMSSGEDMRAMEFVKDQLTDGPGFIAKVLDLYQHPEATSFDVLNFKDGRVFERYSQPQRTTDRVIGRVWSFRDVTERLKAEKAMREQHELQAANDHLRELDRLKTQFINNAAHELGTPLTPIKLQMHLLNSETLGPLSDRQRNSVKVMSRNVDQLGVLLRDVLDSARVQAGRLEVRIGPVDLHRLAQESVESFQEAARQQEVALELKGDPGVIVNLDARRITQVMFNLIRNALKFTPSGGRVEVVIEQTARESAIEVRDTGQGIKAEDIARLFKPFSQVHEEKETFHGGTGLGLYIARGIVESHGGTISCRSGGPGQGATFRVAFPSA